jgi:hypothetical protein
MNARLLLPLITLLGAGCGLVGHVEPAAPTTTTAAAPTVSTGPVYTVTPEQAALVEAGQNGVKARGTGERAIVNVGTGSDGKTSTRVLVVDRNDGDIALFGLPGSWEFTEAVPGAPLEGISWDGSRIVLVSTDDPGRFIAVSVRDARAEPVIIHPTGRFTFDALAHDGKRLLLVEHTTAGRYRIRAFDLPSGALEPAPIVDKTENHAMVGSPVARATAADFVYTVYERTTDAPFVHALAADGTYAVCIDLPAETDAAARAGWRARPHGAAEATITNVVTRTTYRLEGGRLHSIPFEQWSE